MSSGNTASGVLTLPSASRRDRLNESNETSLPGVRETKSQKKPITTYTSSSCSSSKLLPPSSSLDAALRSGGSFAGGPTPSCLGKTAMSARRPTAAPALPNCSGRRGGQLGRRPELFPAGPALINSQISIRRLPTECHLRVQYTAVSKCAGRRRHDASAIPEVRRVEPGQLHLRRRKGARINPRRNRAARWSPPAPCPRRASSTASPHSIPLPSDRGTYTVRNPAAPRLRATEPRTLRRSIVSVTVSHDARFPALPTVMLPPRYPNPRAMTANGRPRRSAPCLIRKRCIAGAYSRRLMGYVGE